MDIFVTIVVLAGVWVWGVLSGWTARERHAERKLNELLSHVESAEDPQENHIQITIEKHKDVFYVYDRQTNNFMAQAPTIKELEETLQQRFPGKKFACPEKNMIEVGLLS